MDATHIADALWQLRWWMAPVFGAFFAIPILRLLTRSFAVNNRAARFLVRRTGRWEQWTGPVRDTIGFAYLGGAIIWHTLALVHGGTWPHACAIVGALALMGLSLLWRRERHAEELRLLDFLRAHAAIHPQEFFDRLDESVGIVRVHLPQTPDRTIAVDDLDFRTNGRGVFIARRKLLGGVFDTIRLTRLALLAVRERSTDVVRQVCGALAIVWASRIAQRIRARVTIEGEEHLAPAGGVQIFAFTHKSFLDFIFACLPLAARTGALEDPAKCLPHFLLAKDHFRDNPIFYRLLGLGRIAEALGMVFVDRTSRDRRRSARAVSDQVLAAIDGPNFDLTLFPQGTRAHPYVDDAGARLDAGYYTVGSAARISADGGHLKKGCAHIATDVQLAFRAAGLTRSVCIVPIECAGTATASPRRSMRIRANTAIRLCVGEPIGLADGDAEGLSRPFEDKPCGDAEIAYRQFTDRLHGRIDRALKNTARVHAELERRFFEDMCGVFEPIAVEEVAVALKPWRGDDYLAHAILDAIYACKPGHRHALMGEFVHQLREFADRDQLLAFKKRIAKQVR